MRHLKTYQIFESKPVLSKDQTEWLDKVCPGAWQLQEDGTVNVLGDVQIARGGINQTSHMKILDMGDGTERQINFKGVQFGMVTGEFDCERQSLRDLSGCPHTVGQNFVCKENGIRDLKGGPKKVRKHYDAAECMIETLDGCPEEVGGTLVLDYNILKDFKGMSPSFNGMIRAEKNKLVSLEGIGRARGLVCYDNPVETETLDMIFEYMKENPEMPYGAILLAIKGKIPTEEWNKLDKSSIEDMKSSHKKAYGMLGGIGGI